jgi:DNA topoisomerase I
LKVYMESTDDENDETQEGILPALSAGDELALRELLATERFTRPPARYTEATLVKKLEELGIGRPSTYAPTISTIQKRQYVTKESREGVKRKYRIVALEDKEVMTRETEENTGVEKNKLFPTDMGMLVTDFLVEHFPSIVDFGFTAEIEKEFDDISNGQLDWRDMLATFYTPFADTVEHTLEHAERATGERQLGVDEKTGKPILVRMARFGPIVQIGSPTDEEKPRMAGLKPGTSLETITLEEALKLFDLPRVVGEYEGKEVKVNTGRFGPYVAHDGKFISLKKDQDPYEIQLDAAIELIEEKRKSVLRDWKEQGVSIVVGRWGPYIKSGKINAKIPKDTDPMLITLEQALEMLEEAKNAPPKKGRFFKKKS